MRENAMKQLKRLKIENSQMQAKADGINFVVNDKVTYTSVSQFKSEETRKAYIQTTKMKSELTAKMSKLAAMRAEYHTATGNKAQIGQQIQQLEQQTNQLRHELKKTLGELRQKECKL